MGRKTFFIRLSAVLLFMAGCGNLEDTYSDFSGNGPIRYVGRCGEVTLLTGWYQLQVNWEKSTDATVEKVKVACTSGNYYHDTVMMADNTSYLFKNLPDASYEINIYSVDHQGNLSLPMIVYGRPFTENHGQYTGFSRIITKHYFVKKNLVLFFDSWQPTFDHFLLKYTDASGQAQEKVIDKAYISGKYQLIKNVDPDQPVTFYRWGRIEDSPQVVEFPIIVLDKNRNFTGDMKVALLERYNESELSEAFVNGLTTLQLDYNMVTFEDVLYFPNLTKLELCKNRYFHPTHVNSSIPPGQYAVLGEPEKSNFVLKVAQELCGLQIDRYLTKNYSTNIYSSGTFATGLTMNEIVIPSAVPAKTCLNKSTWTISSTVDGVGIENLLDNNPSTHWISTSTSMLKTYDIIIDMQQSQLVNGFKISQPFFTTATSTILYYSVPTSIIIQTSEDLANWSYATLVKSNTIGKTNGETTLINMTTPRTARYIKATISDGTNSSGTSFYSYLGDIVVY